MQRSSELFKEAKQYIPGGVNSPVRAFKSVGGEPVFIQKAKDAYLFDVDNKKYIDYINSWGPMILGHANEFINTKIKAQIDLGTSFGTPTEMETEIAKLVVNHVPNVDLVRFVNSGTEACMSAIRLARGFTKKDKIIKFAGCYHGHADAFLIQAGSGAATFGVPSSSGVTQAAAANTILAPYNNLAVVQQILEQNENQIAAIILEPVAGNMGCIPPKEGFLQGLRTLCDQHQVVLIFDEVMTGFRLSIGGAQELYNINADLICFGKIIGGGLPVGAFGGKKQIMECLSPMGSVYQAGTLSGNPVAMTAGLYTLKQLTENPEIYENTRKSTQILDEEITKLLEKKSLPFSTNRVGSMFSVFFSQEEVFDFNSAAKADNAIFKQFFHHALANGVYLPPSSYESWFISNAVRTEQINQTLSMVESFQV